jgi:hypothetical protein
MRDEAVFHLGLSVGAPTPSDRTAYLLRSIAASLIRIGDLLEKAQEKRDADSEQAFNTALHAVSGQ